MHYRENISHMQEIRVKGFFLLQRSQWRRKRGQPESPIYKYTYVCISSSSVTSLSFIRNSVPYVYRYIFVGCPLCLQLVIDEYEKSFGATPFVLRHHVRVTYQSSTSLSPGSILTSTSDRSTDWIVERIRNTKMKEDEVWRYLQTVDRKSSFSIFGTINDAHDVSLSGTVVSTGDSSPSDRRRRGRKNIERKKKVDRKKTSRSFHAHIVHKTIAFFFCLFLLPRLRSTRSINSPWWSTQSRGRRRCSCHSRGCRPPFFLSSNEKTLSRTPQFTVEQDSPLLDDQLQQNTMEARGILTQRVPRHVYDNSAAQQRTPQLAVIDLDR